MGRIAICGFFLAWQGHAHAEGGGVWARAHLGMGWRQDSLHWSIASDRTGLRTPNVMSELRWKEVRSLEARGGAEIGKGRWLFRLEGGYGWIGQGVNEDSDYAGNGRTLEWSRSRNDAGIGHVADASAAAGLRVGEGDAGFVSAWLGYAWHQQFLRMRQGRQVVSKAATINGVVYRAPPLGPFPGLDSRYIATWQGAWIGIGAEWRAANWAFSAMGRLEWDDYLGEANWNLRADLAHPVSFRHRARGRGAQLRARAEYAWRRSLSLAIFADFSRFRTKPGTDTSYSAAGGVADVVRLNGVYWHAASVGVSVAYRF
ncbi:MAG: hypothetical protein D6771_07385 [Zetaproteobacteria bacterium]|nr:MAG: hypothetical protein D6771_07385 [Zetaproteobacteria bacterium]